MADIAEREPVRVQAMIHPYSVNNGLVGDAQFTILGATT